MATYTSNYNLEKPAQTDLYNVDVFNGNMDIVDAVLGKHETGIAVIEPNETASTNYEAGRYIMWHSTLYKTRVAISAGEALSNTNLIEAHVGNRLYVIETQLALTPVMLTMTTGSSVTMANQYSIYSPLSKVGQIMAYIAVGASQPLLPLTIESGIGTGWSGGGVYVPTTGWGGAIRFSVTSAGQLQAQTGLPSGNYYVLGTAKAS